MEILVAICAGIGLAAACGFRVFAPLLAMGIGVHAEAIAPGKGFEWVGSWPALIALGAATLTEVSAYYIPWLDHALDTIATPAALVAGTVAMGAVMPDMPGWLKWSSALIAGGGSAGVIQGGTVLTRTLSGATTGGLGNFVVSTGELIGAIVLAMLAILVPIVAALVVMILIMAIVKQLMRWMRRRRKNSEVIEGDGSFVRDRESR